MAVPMIWGPFVGVLRIRALITVLGSMLGRLLSGNSPIRV